MTADACRCLGTKKIMRNLEAAWGNLIQLTFTTPVVVHVQLSKVPVESFWLKELHDLLEELCLTLQPTGFNLDDMD